MGTFNLGSIKPWLIALMLLLPAVAQAGTITYNFGNQLVRTTTAGQDTKLTGYLATVNAERATRGLPALTLEQYLDSVLIGAVTSYIKELEKVDAITACQAFDQQGGGSQATAIATYFGGKDPCP